MGAGWAHTCVILDNHSVRCWGYGGHVENGDGRNASPVYRELCPLGLVKDLATALCRTPALGKYADPQGVEQSCDTNNPIADSASLGGQPLPFVTEATCPFTCNATHLKKEDDRSCGFR